MVQREENVTTDTEIGLKEEGGIEMSTTVLHYAMLALFALNTYLNDREQHVSM